MQNLEPSLSAAPKKPPLASIFVLKIAERCNLNCSYCYMYNKGDSSYRQRPKFMSSEVATAMLGQIARYALRHNLRQVSLALHGGEPLLAGRQWVKWFLEEARRVTTATSISWQLSIQTNGTLLDQEWVELLSGHDVSIGISCDGPEEWNRERLDLAGRSSYLSVRRAIEFLVATPDVRWSVLTVVDPQAPPRTVLQHFVDLGVRRLDFLWPDFNHDAPPPWPPGSLARYFCELFDFWYDEVPSPPRIRWFEDAMVLLLGGRANSDALGSHPVADIMVESDGTWEPIDTLRICGDGITRTGLDVRRCDVEAIWDFPLYQLGLRNQELLPEQCQSCAYRRVCGGGYLPHRYRRETGFANPSIYCADLLVVLAHIRQRIVADLAELQAAAVAC